MTGSDKFDVESKFVTVDEYADGVAAIIKPVVDFLDTLPDEMARNAGLTPDQVTKLRAAVARRRNELLKQLGDRPLPTFASKEKLDG